MHLKCFLPLLLLLFSSTLFSQNTIPQPTHYIVQSSYSSNVPLSNSEQGYIFFDANGRETQTSIDIWSGSAWTLSSRNYSTYDAAGRLTERVSYCWDPASAGMKLCSRVIFNYNTVGLETLQNYWAVNAATNTLEEQYRFTTTYTATNKAQSVTRLYYQNSIPSFGSRSLMAYDAQDRVSEVIQHKMQSGSWLNEQRRIYYYNDPDDRVDRVDIQTWNSTLANWNSVSSYEISTYLPFVTTTETYTITNGVANISNKNTTVYNAAGQMTVNNIETWDAATQGLRLQNGYENIYNADKSRQQFRYYYRDQTGVYFQSLQIDYDYGLYTGVKNAATLPNVQVFPNPATDIVQVHWTSDNPSQEVRIVLTDAQGNLIEATTEQQETATFSLTDQPCGLYFIRVEQGGRMRVMPVVKQ